jgi:hypothetical protein
LRYRISFSISFFIIFSLPPVLYAQRAPTASIVYSMGGDFSLTRSDGSSNTYGPSYTSKNPVPLQNSDYIQTAAGVFVEALVSPGGASIIVAENTYVIFENISGSGAPNVISLVYGRVRVSQRRTSATTIVKAGASVTEIQNGSVNFDLVLPPGGTDSRLVFYASTLSGTAVFMPSAASPETARIRIRQNETIIFNTHDSEVYRQSINKDIVDYWMSKTRRKTVNARGEGLLDPADVDKIISPFSDLDPDYNSKAAYLKTRFLIAGAFTVLAGVAVQSVAHFAADSLGSEIGEYTFYAGYMPLGLGIFMLIGAYFY